MKDEYKSIVAGGGAGCAATLITVPFDIIKIRLQNQLTHKSAYETIVSIYKKESVFGFYRGISTTAFAYLPTWALYFSIYDYSKQLYSPNLGQSSFLLHAFSAFQAGICSTVITNPLWVVRSKS